MSLSSRMIIVLTSVGLLSGALLSTVGLLTRDRIEANRQQAIREAISIVVPDSDKSKKIYEESDYIVYKTTDENDVLQGFAVYTSGTGFQDKIVLMFGTDPSLKTIFRLTILDQKETPGLGAKITSQEDFLRFWENRDCSQSLKLHKPAVESPQELNPSEVNTITGATISSEAVLNTVNNSLAKLRTLLETGTLVLEEEDAS